MKEIVWEKKKEFSEKKGEKILEKIMRGDKRPPLEKEITIGFNADQFFVRLPKQFSESLQLKSEQAKEKKYKFKISWYALKGIEKNKSIKGTFEVIKND